MTDGNHKTRGMTMMTIGNKKATIGSTLAARCGEMFVIKEIDQFYIVATDENGQEVKLSYSYIIKFRVVSY